MTTIRLPDIAERDIDLLLLEEFVASPDFSSWFLSLIGQSTEAALSEASRSVKTDTGESDLELTFEGKGGTVKLLIENKVDAVFQPNQPQRYAARADGHKEGGQYSAVVTVIMAPEAYFGDESETYGFDARVTYEDVLSWFSAPERKCARTDYKLALLRISIERGGTGWQLVPNPKVGQFWQHYWRLATRLAPQLSMPAPKKEIPTWSHFVVFRPAALPTNIKLKHKVGYGNVDLEFRGMGGQLAEMDRLYRAVLPANTQIEKAAKSAVIRARVEPVDMSRQGFASCETAMRRGIEEAARLLDWYVEAHRSSKPMA